jgi:hypothetical protein
MAEFITVSFFGFFLVYLTIKPVKKMIRLYQNLRTEKFTKVRSQKRIQQLTFEVQELYICGYEYEDVIGLLPQTVDEQEWIHAVNIVYEEKQNG